MQFTYSLRLIGDIDKDVIRGKSDGSGEKRRIMFCFI